MHTNIKSPLNYTGGKFKLLPQLQKYFLEHVDTFYDVFTGGANVGINANANNIICIDKEELLINLYTLLKNTTLDEIECKLYSIIDEYNLSLSSKYGYSYYNFSHSTDIAYYNKENYNKLRTDFNIIKDKKGVSDTHVLFLFFVLVIHSFNNQIRFNSNNHFNVPVGSRDFNSSLTAKLKLFKARLDALNIQFQSKSYKDIDINSISDNSFFYFDPPYLLAMASYNGKGWTEKDEHELYAFIDELNNKNIKFALSNVLIHKGMENHILKDWQKKYNLINLNYNYNNCSYHHKNKAETMEILVTNY